MKKLGERFWPTDFGQAIEKKYIWLLINKLNDQQSIKFHVKHKISSIKQTLVVV